VKLTERARRLNLASGRLDLPPVILVSDVERLPDPSAALERLPAGSAVLVRHPDGKARAKLAERLLPLTHLFGIRLLISDDLALALDLCADGLHLPEAIAATDAALGIRRAWRGRLLTMAAHSPAALLRCARIGADAAIVSPVFATASHPGRRPIGLLRFMTWVQRAPVPVYAMGGITAASIGRLCHPKVAGVAAIEGLVSE